MFRRILVAIDGSSHADRALDVAVDLAQRYEASLCLIHAFPHVSDLLGDPQYERLLETRTAQGEMMLGAARARAGTSVPVETQLIEGPPAPAILRVAAEEAYDLIVVGSRGHGQLAGVLLGSVSSIIAQRASCPVMIVHEPAPLPVR
jgi:nucleotide-binding universal stress UspA family protein